MIKKLVRFDWAMKKILRHKANFDVLEGFLSELLGEDVKIKRQGKDYVYHGTTIFKGIHKGDILGLSDKQMQVYQKDNVHEIYPEYWVIKTGKFRNRINDRLDEWIYFLKNAEIKPSFSAKGLKEAKEKLDTMKLPEKERAAYDKYLLHLMSIASRNHTIEIETKEIIKKAHEEKEIEFILEMTKEGLSVSMIAKIAKKTEEEIKQLVDSQASRS